MSLGKEDEKNSAELDRKRVAMRCLKFRQNIPEIIINQSVSGNFDI